MPTLNPNLQRWCQADGRRLETLELAFRFLVDLLGLRHSRGNTTKIRAHRFMRERVWIRHAAWVVGQGHSQTCSADAEAERKCKN